MVNLLMFETETAAGTFFQVFYNTFEFLGSTRAGTGVL